jgi:hypothetical protein
MLGCLANMASIRELLFCLMQWKKKTLSLWHPVQ